MIRARVSLFLLLLFCGVAGADGPPTSLRGAQLEQQATNNIPTGKVGITNINGTAYLHRADNSLAEIEPAGGSSFYQTVELNTVDQTQRDQLNFSSQFSAADSSSPSRTTISIVSLAQSVITNLVTDLAAKALAVTQIIAGTGLSGGGTLAADRTLSLNLGNANTWTASQNVASVALSDGATISTNAALGNVFTVTIAGDRTLANPTNLVNGGTYVWVVTQDGSGSHSLAFGSDFKWSAGAAPTVAQAADAVSLISAVRVGGVLLATMAQDLR